MKMRIGALAAGVVYIGLVSSGFGQRGIVDRSGSGNYEDISQRKTRSTEREDRKKKEAEEAKKKAEEEKRRDERRKRYEEENNRRNGDNKPATGMSSSNNRSTTGSKTANNRNNRGPGKNAGAATQPVTAGGGTDPTTQEVNEVILNSVKTQKVDFDVEAARKNPDIILLNEPKFDPSDRVRAGDTGMAQPL